MRLEFSLGVAQRRLMCVRSLTSQRHPPGNSAPASGTPPPGQADGGWRDIIDSQEMDELTVERL